MRALPTPAAQVCTAEADRVRPVQHVGHQFLGQGPSRASLILSRSLDVQSLSSPVRSLGLGALTFGWRRHRSQVAKVEKNGAETVRITYEGKWLPYDFHC